MLLGYRSEEMKEAVNFWHHAHICRYRLYNNSCYPITIFLEDSLYRLLVIEWCNEEFVRITMITSLEPKDVFAFGMTLRHIYGRHHSLAF